MLSFTIDAHAQDSNALRKGVFKPRKLILIMLLLSTLLFSLYQVRQARSLAIHVGPTGPPQYDYSRIQDAQDAATAGDTIEVAAGIYYEHVTVNKSLTIVGENPQTTIVDGTGNGIVFTLDASNSIITGFTIRNAGNTFSAISITRDLVTSDFDVISNNIITTNQYGVYISLSDQNMISGNSITTSKQYGIYISGSDQNTISGNTIVNNQLGGIYVNGGSNENITSNTIRGGPYGIRGVTSPNNVIVGNTISQTSYAIHLASSSTGNIVRRNMLSGQTAGVYTSSSNTIVDHNTVAGGSSGLYLANCVSGSIYYNSITDSSYGIRLYWSSPTTSSHSIDNNKVSNTDWAIEIQNANGNAIRGNWLQQNVYGIYMTASSSNVFYHNNFVDDDVGAYAGTGTGNVWDQSGQGNYWSNYTGVDADNNGIGDTFYRILPIGYDNYPLMRTWSEHDVAILSVSSSTNKVCHGATVVITVIVRNNANTSVSETFTVTAKYGSINIETKTVSNLAQGATQILTFNWDTAGVASGNYTISAAADPMPDELNTDNNNDTDGTVLVTIGDLDHDNNVDGMDYGLFAICYGSTSGQPKYNREADFDYDGDVDGVDFGVFSLYYGRNW